MGIMTINGAHAGAFSPISVSGVLVRDIVESSGLTIAPWTLFFASYGINLLLSVLTVVGYGILARVRNDLEFTATGSSPGIDPDGGGSALRTPTSGPGEPRADRPVEAVPRYSSGHRAPRPSPITTCSRSPASRNSPSP